MGSKLEIDVLRALKAIQDTGGVSRAAEALSLSQSAVSHKIRRLEHNIGSEILQRKAGSALFTEDGQHLVEYAERIIEIHDEALAGINRQPLNGRIRLGLTEEMVTTGLAQVLGRFNRIYPGVQIKTLVDQSLGLQERLGNASIDLAVMQVFKDEVREKDIVIREDRLLWVKSKAYQVPGSGDLPFISFDENCFYRKWASARFRNESKNLSVVLECASNEGVCSAVLAGIGVALIGERVLKSGMQDISDDFPDPPNLAFVIRCADNDPSTQTAALSDEITLGLV